MTIDEAAALRSRVPESALLPGDVGYDEARVSFNGMIDRRPAAIVTCTSTDDVVAAVRAARAAGLPIAIRGGGHSVAGHGIADGAVVVDLRGMRRVIVDPERKVAQAEGGALWEDVDRATTAHGLAVPGGTFIDTGIGGLTLGGGIGWLMPIAGLTCDNLIAAEVVTADGSVVTAGADGDPELLWALRGGGGNFGVVTRFTYRLTPIAPIWGGRINYPADAAGEILARVDRLLASHPFSFLPTIGIRHTAEFGVQVQVMIGVMDGSDPEPFADALRRDLPIQVDDLGPLSYMQLQAMSGLLPFGLRHYWKGRFLRSLNRELLESLVAMRSDPDARDLDFILIEAVVGAGRVEPEGGAAFGQREALWNASALGIWESPEDDEASIRWARRTAALLEPYSVSGAGYVNYSPADEPAERVQAAYGNERWERLIAVKRRYDPANVFRFNHNIVGPMASRGSAADLRESNS